jgi:hypothetical protein
VLACIKNTANCTFSPENQAGAENHAWARILRISHLLERRDRAGSKNRKSGFHHHSLNPRASRSMPLLRTGAILVAPLR